MRHQHTYLPFVRRAPVQDAADLSFRIGGELLLDYWTSDGSFSYDVQTVGVIDGKNVTAGCWDADQGTDHSDDPSYRGYFDSEEGCWLFMTIWRVGGSLAAYGYDAFIED